MAVAREGQKHGMNKARADTTWTATKTITREIPNLDSKHETWKNEQERTNKDKWNHRT